MNPLQQQDNQSGDWGSCLGKKCCDTNDGGQGYDNGECTGAGRDCWSEDAGDPLLGYMGYGNKSKGKAKGKGGKGDDSHITCNYCWAQGHMKRNCPILDKAMEEYRASKGKGGKGQPFGGKDSKGKGVGGYGKGVGGYGKGWQSWQPGKSGYKGKGKGSYTGAGGWHGHPVLGSFDHQDSYYWGDGQYSTDSWQSQGAQDWPTQTGPGSEKQGGEPETMTIPFFGSFTKNDQSTLGDWMQVTKARTSKNQERQVKKMPATPIENKFDCLADGANEYESEEEGEKCCRENTYDLLPEFVGRPHSRSPWLGSQMVQNGFQRKRRNPFRASFEVVKDEDESDDEDFLKDLFRERTPEEEEAGRKAGEAREAKRKEQERWHNLSPEEQNQELEWEAMKSFHLPPKAIGVSRRKVKHASSNKPFNACEDVDCKAAEFPNPQVQNKKRWIKTKCQCKDENCIRADLVEPPGLKMRAKKTAMAFTRNDRRTIGAVAETDRTIEVMVDSGASESVMPAGWFEDYQLMDGGIKGVEFASADGGTITILGERKLALDLADGTTKGFTFQVGDKATRPLGSVHRIVQKGNRVVFSASGSYIENEQTGERIWMRESQGVYVLDAQVRRLQPFRRRD